MDLLCRLENAKIISIISYTANEILDYVILC